MLQVRFAEVNRNALQQAGLAMFVSRANWVGALDDAGVSGAGLRGRRRSSSATS